MQQVPTARLDVAVAPPRRLRTRGAAPVWRWPRSAQDSTGTPTDAADRLLLGVMQAVIARALGRNPGLALAIVLPVLGFEVALHSVHHLDDPAGASDCVVASVATHLHGTGADVPRVDLVLALAPEELTRVPRAPEPHRFAAPHEGRAPPSPA